MAIVTFLKPPIHVHFAQICEILQIYTAMLVKQATSLIRPSTLPRELKDPSQPIKRGTSLSRSEIPEGESSGQTELTLQYHSPWSILMCDRQYTRS